MLRIIGFLVLLAAIALGTAWIADQGGGISLLWHGWLVQTSVPVFVLAAVVVIVLAIVVWSILRAIWKTPARLRHRREERRRIRGRDAITRGLIAIGTGDQFAARRYLGIAT